MACIAAASLWATGAAGAANAAAPVVPDAYGVTSCGNGVTVVTSGASSCANGGASAFFAETPFATAQAVVAGPVGLTQAGTSDLNYSFTIAGPDHGPIDIGISLHLLTAATFGSSAFAQLTSSGGASICAQTGETGCVGSKFDGTLHEFDSVGVVYSLHLEVIATMNGAFGGSALASVDPHIFIDPSDPHIADYSITLSEGVSNVTAGVPEPAGWALLLTGFAALGAALRARRSLLTA
jgi:hypothetical protein